MFDLPSWLLVIPVLAFLIFVHELGHFIAAKRFGIGVIEFGFGFPPRLVGVRPVGPGRLRLVVPGPIRRLLGRGDFPHDYEEHDPADEDGGTIYSVNAIPLGGFVRMLGEEDPSAPDSFARKGPLARTIVLCAGSFMNLLVAAAILTALLVIGRDTLVGSVRITGVAPNSPAEQAGLLAGDYIVAIQQQPIDNIGDLKRKIEARLGGATEITICRGSVISCFDLLPDYEPREELVVTVTPRLDPPNLLVVDEVTDPSREVSLAVARRYYGDTGIVAIVRSGDKLTLLEPPNDDNTLAVGNTLTQGAIGVRIETANPKVVKRSQPVWRAVPMSFGSIWEILTITKNGLHRWIAGGEDPGLAGPVGIAQITGEAANAGGLLPVLELTAFISLSLAIVNVLPIPGLDGGRLMFVLLEWARGGKRVSPQREGLIHFAGFVLLIGLVVVITYFDVSRILNGDSFIR